MEFAIQCEGELFEDVQQSEIFSDSKTFVDSIPKQAPKTIFQLYLSIRNDHDFNLRDFIDTHFIIPGKITTTKIESQYSNMEDHIKSLWSLLTRKPSSDSSHYSTLIELPYPYIVPGGRFDEIYYWDSYFTAEGLAYCGHLDMVVNMAKNFAYLIDKIGHIPNGNRVYYTSRSQPPFFCCLLSVIERYLGFEAVQPFINALEREYRFWMAEPNRRTVRLDNGAPLNRYWSDTNKPRPESYREDKALFAKVASENKSNIYRNISASCESGWDFSSRWFRDGQHIETLYTTELIPVDLNAILFNLESQLARYLKSNNPHQSQHYSDLAETRKQAIEYYCWDDEKQFYFDYCFTEQKRSPAYTLAACTPLFFKLSSQKQADAVAKQLQDQFLHPGGLTTTLTETNQQWDKPNGWAPLHWLAVKGLINYGHDQLAKTIAKRWLQLNRNVFARNHKMLEKYNVCDINLPAGGGEYPLQDGFGWTNAIAITFIELLK